MCIRYFCLYRIAEYAEGAIKLDELGAKKEILGDFVGEMLFGGENQISDNLFAELEDKHKKTFREWISAVLERIRSIFAGDKKAVSEIDKLETMFREVLKESVEGHRNTNEESNSFSYTSNEKRFIEDKYFKSQMSKWETLKHGSYIKVGTIEKNHPLHKVGMPDGVLRYDVDKLKKNMIDHSDYLNIDLLKAIPNIIASPMAISEFSAENTVSVFGDVFVGNSPMMVGVTISKDRGGNDISKVRTYNTRRDVGKLVNNNTVLYLNEDKKRTRKWFQACGIQVPLGETKFGFIRSISQKKGFVNTSDEKNSNEAGNTSILHPRRRAGADPNGSRGRDNGRGIWQAHAGDQGEQKHRGSIFNRKNETRGYEYYSRS